MMLRRVHPQLAARWDRLRRSDFFKNSLAYSGANTLGQLATFASGLALRRIFPPALMGYWNLRSVAQGVLGTFDLGADQGAARELPLLTGQGRTQELALCRSTAFWFACLQAVTITLAWCLYAVFRRNQYSPMEFTVMIVSGILFILSDLQAVYITFFCSSQAYRPLSRVLFISTVTEAVLIPAVAFWGGLYAVFAAAILAAIARTAYFSAIAARAGIGVSFSFSKLLLLKLVKLGLAMRISEYPGSVSKLLPILCVTKFLGLEQLAIFSLAVGLAGQVGDVSTRIGTIFMTRFIQRAGGGAAGHIQAEEMRRFLTLNLLVAVPLLCWVGGFLLPAIIYLFIPKYGAAVETTMILLVSLFFLTINSGLTIYWTTQGTFYLRGIADMAGLCFMTLSLAITWFFFQERTINGIAWASVFGSAGYFGYMVFAVGKDLWPFPIRLSTFLWVLVAAVWTFYVLHFMASDAATYSSISVVFQTTCLRGVSGLIALIPLITCGVWISGVLKSETIGGWENSP